MWNDAKTPPEKSGWYLGVFECSGRHGCGMKCSGVRCFYWQTAAKTAAVYGIKCRFHGNVLYDIPMDAENTDSCGRIVSWQELPERP